jgi:ornithine carbamoyltransferase
MYDGIEYRGFKQETVEILAQYSGVPVWNGLTDRYHPTQILADFMTVLEYKGTLKGIKFAYFGDARNNMGNSLMIGSAKMGLDFRAVAPKSLWPEEELYKKCLEIAQTTGATITLTEDVEKGAKDVDVLYTDVWVSMGMEKERAERERIFMPYQVNKELTAHAKKNFIFMHCLPAHRGLEVSAEIMDGKNSVVFDEAENRLHAQKAILLELLV